MTVREKAITILRLFITPILITALACCVHVMMPVPSSVPSQQVATLLSGVLAVIMIVAGVVASTTSLESVLEVLAAFLATVTSLLAGALSYDVVYSAAFEVSGMPVKPGQAVCEWIVGTFVVLLVTSALVVLRNFLRSRSAQ